MHEFNGKILYIAEKQREARIGGEVVKISTDKYVCLRATVTNDTLHHDILSGGISRSQFKRQYNGKQGFGVSFDGTTYSHPIVWKTMIDHASDLLVYSPPLEGARRYDLLFKGKVDTAKLRSIFYVMAQETMGDFYSSSALYTAYCRRSLVVCQSMLDKEVTERLLEFNETNRSKSFFTAFDNMCRRMFAKVLVQMNDHNKPIIPIECFDTYVDMG
jgi:hypothetical protein